MESGKLQDQTLFCFKMDTGQSIAFQQEVARLQALLEASRRIHGHICEGDVLKKALEIAVKEIEADWGLFTQPLVTFGDVTLADLQTKSLDASRFPLRGRNNEVMTELVLRRAGEALSLEEEDFIEGLVLQTSVALENARHYQRELEFQRIEQDLAAARIIQRSLLPQSLPPIPGCSVAARSVACYEVGGDYVDIMTAPGGGFIMIVADVAGKGLASAIVSTSFRSAFRAMASSGIPLDELAQRISQLHWAEGPEARRRYVTAALMHLSSDGNVLQVLNAGHNPGFLLSPSHSPRQVDASGTPLGLLPRASYKIEEFDFTPGSRLLLYTDGLTEVFQDDDEFGSDRLMEAFCSFEEADCDLLLDSLWKTLGEFSGGAPARDDMTALALFRH